MRGAGVSAAFLSEDFSSLSGPLDVSLASFIFSLSGGCEREMRPPLRHRHLADDDALARDDVMLVCARSRVDVAHDSSSH